MTATNDDRASVARALREMETPTWPTLTEAVMGHVAAREKVVERLADLIEPPRQCPYYHSERHYCSAYDDVVDREALLALAEEMEQAGKDYRYQMVENACCDNLIDDGPDDFIGYARRFREACGVEP